MIDFDDLGDAEEEREEEEAPLRAALEAQQCAEEEAQEWSARVVGAAGNDRVPVFSSPSNDAPVVGERKAGDVVRLARKVGGYCLLHPLELCRVAVDYQDYWHAILKNEVPRTADAAWLPAACLQGLRPGDFSGAGKAETMAAVEPAEEPWLSEDLGDVTATALVAKTLTLIISTSPAEHHCNVGLMLQVMRSLQANPALHLCRKLIVFDAMPGDADRQSAQAEGNLADSGERWVPHGNDKLAIAYDAYKKALKQACDQGDPAMHEVELLFMPKWGHLVGTVRYAMENLSTPYVLLHQHDLLLSNNFTSSHVVSILQMLAQRKANYVLLNRDVNFVRRSTQYFQAAPHRPDLWRVFWRKHHLELENLEHTALTPFVGYSDQTHLARTQWVKDCVLRRVGERKCCMEFTLHETLLLAWLHQKDKWEKTFMLGGMDDGPYIYDSQKNGYCWADVEDSYSDEKMEDVFVRREDCIYHPDRPSECLSLYIFRSGEGCRPGQIFHYPDTDMEPNRLSREQVSVQPRGVSLGKEARDAR